MLSVIAVFASLTTLSFAQHCCTPNAWQGEFHSTIGYVTSGEYNPKFARVSYKQATKILCTCTVHVNVNE